MMISSLSYFLFANVSTELSLKKERVKKEPDILLALMRI